MHIPHDIVDKKWALCEIVLDGIPTNFYAYKELQTECKEDG